MTSGKRTHKMPMPFYVKRDIEAGLTITQIADKYGILRIQNVKRFIEQNGLPQPVKGKGGPITGLTKLRKASALRERAWKPETHPAHEAEASTGPRPDHRRVVISRPDFRSTGHDAVQLRISLPRLTFLHGHWDGSDTLHRMNT